MTQSTPVPEAVIEAAYSGEPLDNRPPEAMDGRTVQYIYSYGYSTGRSHAAEAVRRAALTSPPKAEAGEAEAAELIRQLCGTDLNGGFIRDLCFTVWSICHNPTHEDGNADWGSDTLPTVQAGVAKVRAALEAALNPGATTP